MRRRERWPVDRAAMGRGVGDQAVFAGSRALLRLAVCLVCCAEAALCVLLGGLWRGTGRGHAESIAGEGSMASSPWVAGSCATCAV